MAKAVVVGFGSIGKRHCRLLVEYFGVSNEDVLVIESQPNRSLDAASAGYTLTSFDELERSDVSLAVVAASTSAHGEILRRLPRTLKRIYIEKPIGISMLDVGGALRDKDRSETEICIGYILRQHPVIRKIVELSESVNLGPLLKYSLVCGQYLPNWHPWEDYRSFYMSSVDGGGGALLDISHEIDLAILFAGKVNRAVGTVNHISSLDVTCDDSVDMMFEHANGVRGMVSLDLISKRTVREGRLIFDRGEISYDLVSGSCNWGVQTATDLLEHSKTFSLDADQLYLDQYGEFFSENGSFCGVSTGLHVMQIIEAVRLSDKVGGAVKVESYPL